MKINIHREVDICPTLRTEMLGTMFDVPTKEKLTVSLNGEADFDARPWSIGLIVGPSGSGKTLLLNELFGAPSNLEWNSRSVIDDFPDEYSMEDITNVCQCVGFNSIPSWLRPFSVLSNGEKFRVETARRLLHSTNDSGNVCNNITTIDEFSSVVDRQVAQFASYSIAKYIRTNGKRLVAASCHYDIIDWLQPDWLLEPGRECKLTWRSLQQRPSINVSISRVKYETWHLFKEFHYMSQDLNKAARCYGLFVERSASELGGDTEPERSSSDDMAQHRLETVQDLHRDGQHDKTHEESPGHDESYSEAGVRNTARLDSKLHEHVLRDCSTREDTHNRGSGPDSRIPSAELRDTEGSKSVVLRKGNGSYGASDRRADVLRCSSNHHATTFNTTTGRDIRDTIPRPSQNTRRIATMCGVLHRPHPKVADICGISRIVTLPDFQGLGLAFALVDTIAAAYKALGKRLHNYPNHPAYIRSYQRSKNWLQVKSGGEYSPRRGATSTVQGFGNKRCAVFMYIGPSMNVEEAEHLIYPEGRPRDDE